MKHNEGIEISSGRRRIHIHIHAHAHIHTHTSQKNKKVLGITLDSEPLVALIFVLVIR